MVEGSLQKVKISITGTKVNKSTPYRNFYFGYKLKVLKMICWSLEGVVGAGLKIKISTTNT